MEGRMELMDEGRKKTERPKEREREREERGPK
jgi:hypothetical protein